MQRIFSATLWGLQPIKVDVEVAAHRGIPGLHIIGLPNKTIGEAKERIISSLYHCGIKPKSQRIIINLAPADVPKKSSHLELAIAIGLLKQFGYLETNTDSTFFCGELSLSGKLRPVKGVLPLTLAAKQLGFQHVIIPAANKAEVATLKGVSIHPLNHISEYLAFARQQKALPVLKHLSFKSLSQRPSELDWLEIPAFAQRALQISAAGGHHLLLIGPPGSGKSVLAQTLANLLPPLTEPEAIEVTNLYSTFGLNQQQLITTRPFRAPHHSISTTGLVGGGTALKPGEISLAHRGVLFLDEFLECKRATLEALRIPLEQGFIQLSRAEGQVTYPASFSLVAACNPCLCGFAGTEGKTCTCSAKDFSYYQGKLSGPLLDRIDLSLWVTPQKMSINKMTDTTNWSKIRRQIEAARELQQKRYAKRPFTLNFAVPAAEIQKFCQLDSSAKTFLVEACNRLHLSHRSYHKLIRVSQTIADLESAPCISLSHVAEALQFRLEKRNGQHH